MMSSEDLKKEHYISRRVIVRIWTSRGNPHHPGADVGHISVATPNTYISLWPHRREGEGSGIVCPVSHEFFTYAKDLEFEKREPEVICCFYTLDYIAMERAFDELKDRLKGWVLVGGVFCQNAESCASGAYRILQEGGIQNLMSTQKQSSMVSSESSSAFWTKKSHSAAGSSYLLTGNKEGSQVESQASMIASVYSIEMGLGAVIQSPDKLALVLGEAKRQEIMKYPILGTIVFPDETQVSVKEATTCCLQ